MTVDVVNRRDRIAGGLLGVHAGDSLGATVEFSSWETIRQQYPSGLREIVGGGPFRWPPGHATDDTDLTRAVLRAHLQPGDDVVRAAADQMLAWWNGDWPDREPGTRPRDVGGATADGLRRYRATRDPRASGAGVGRAGNGSLMRCLPTAFAAGDRQQRVRESMEISAITHDDPRCLVACAAYNEIAAALLDGATPEDAVGTGRDVAVDVAARLAAPAGPDPATVAEAIAFGRHLKPAVLAATGPGSLEDAGSGYVLDSLSLAVAAVLDARPFPDVVVDIVRIGKDTDTNGAIAGGLLGVRDGVHAIPPQWTAVLQFADEFRAAADQLA